jgi:hypothetical protein
VVDALAQDGLVEPVKSFFKITTAGVDAAARTLDAVRAEIDHTELAAVYETFSTTNGDFKATVTDWQLRTVPLRQWPDHLKVGNPLHNPDGRGTTGPNDTHISCEVLEVPARSARRIISVGPTRNASVG